MTEQRLLELAENVNMDVEDVRKMYKRMEKDIILSKYNFPTKPSTDGYYHIQVKDLTTKSGRRSFKAKTLDSLRDKVYLFDRGVDHINTKTFKQIFEIVKQNKLEYVKDEEKRLSVSNTVSKMQSDYNRFFANTEIESKPITDISKRDLENVCLINLKRHKLASKAFNEGLCGILRKIFEYAYQEYLIDDNPYLRLNQQQFKDMFVRTTSVDKRAHNDYEVKRIFDYIQEKHELDPTYMPAYALELQMIMGLRRGEVPPLRWADIHDTYILLSRIMITVKRGELTDHEYYQIVEHTKNYKDRKYPVTDEIAKLLKKIRLAQIFAGIDSQYLFPADNEYGVITNNTVYGFYRRACKKLGIKISRECIKGTHSFRRNAITRALNNSGGDELLVSKIFGNTPKVAHDHYYLGIDLERAKSVLER